MHIYLRPVSCNTCKHTCSPEQLCRKCRLYISQIHNVLRGVCFTEGEAKCILWSDFIVREPELLQTQHLLPERKKHCVSVQMCVRWSQTCRHFYKSVQTYENDALLHIWALQRCKTPDWVDRSPHISLNTICSCDTGVNLFFYCEVTFARRRHPRDVQKDRNTHFMHRTCKDVSSKCIPCFQKMFCVCLHAYGQDVCF